MSDTGVGSVVSRRPIIAAAIGARATPHRHADMIDRAHYQTIRLILGVAFGRSHAWSDRQWQTHRLSGIATHQHGQRPTQQRAHAARGTHRHARAWCHAVRHAGSAACGRGHARKNRLMHAKHADGAATDMVLHGRHRTTVPEGLLYCDSPVLSACLAYICLHLRQALACSRRPAPHSAATAPRGCAPARSPCTNSPAARL